MNKVNDIKVELEKIKNEYLDNIRSFLNSLENEKSLQRKNNLINHPQKLK